MKGSPPGPGTIIGGKYRLDFILGQGGMGRVFAAENLLTGKRVAIKCLNAELLEDDEATGRFMREAKVSARIRHPNVVDVYDVLNEDGDLFLIMELLEGSPLSDFLATETVPIPRLIELLVAAMRGVAAAHRQGVVHRDVKPENIFLAVEGDDDQRWVPKVLDFGISKIQGTQEIAITAPGAALGTLLYMAVEQLNAAGDVDARADVYAFGVILYQAITGRFPFFADTVPALVMQIFTAEPVPVKQLRHDVPTKLADLVARAMARAREDRVQTLEELIAELLPFADQAKYGQWLTRTSSKPVVARPRAKTQSAAAHEPTTRAPRGKPILAPQPSTETPFVANVHKHLAREPRRTGAVVAGALAVAAMGVAAAAFRGAREEPPSETSVSPATSVPASPSPSDRQWRPEPPVHTQPQRMAAAGAAAPADAARPQPAAAAPQPAVPATERAAPAPTAPPGAVARPVSSAIPAPKPPIRTTPPRSTAAPTPIKRPGCDPNFVLDEQGEKHFKPQCF